MTERVAAIMGKTPLRREQILNALFRLVARVGYERATVTEIAREADVARGALAYYFGQKDDILRSLARAVCLNERERWQRTVLAGEEPVQQLRAALHVLLRTGDPTRRDFARNWTAFTAIALRDERLRRWLDEYQKDLAERLGAVLVNGVRRRSFRPIEVAPMALSIIGTIEGALQQWAGETRATVIDRSAEIIEDMIVGHVTGRTQQRPDRTERRG